MIFRQRSILTIVVSILIVSCYARAPRLIENITTEGSKLKISINQGFKKRYLLEDFFVHYGSDIELDRFDYSVKSMPFLMNVITLVWISGKTYFVEEMDRQLFETLKKEKRIFEAMYPKTDWSGALEVGTLVDHSLSSQEDPSKTAVLFSGGVDSLSTSLAHLDKKQLLITAWGHWDLPLANKKLWKIRSDKIKQYAQEFGNEVSVIRSNYSSFLQFEKLSKLSEEIGKWRLGAVEGLGWAGLTAPIMLTKGYSVLRIASSHTWQYPYPAASNPFVDMNLHFCGLKVLHDQFEYTRCMKVAAICKWYEEHNEKPPFLKICSFEKERDANCLVCRKCLTTLLCFHALGRDPKPYGLRSSPELLSQAVKEFSKNELNFYTILIGKELQELYRKRQTAGESLDKYCHAFLAIDFDVKEAFDVCHKIPLNWKQMIEFLPEGHGLVIPPEIQAQCLKEESCL